MNKIRKANLMDLMGLLIHIKILHNLVLDLHRDQKRKEDSYCNYL